MPSFLPKLFKPRTPKRSSTESTENSKEKKRWGFPLLKRRSFPQLPKRFRKGKTKDDSTEKPQGSLPPVVPVRRRRRPNLATTQRKLAASKKRIRLQHQCKETSTPFKQVPRRVTEITEAPESSDGEMETKHDPGSVRRSITHPEFQIKGKRGTSGIQVEFIDESPSPDNLAWKQKNLPMSIMASSVHKAGEIGVEWKMPPTGVSSSEGSRSVTPSRHFSPPSDLSSIHSSRTGQGIHCKSVISSDCGSASGSSDVVMEAWTEYRRDRVIEKLSGLKIQQPMQSQCFEAKKVMKTNPEPQQSTVISNEERDSNAPEWIQKWNSSFRSLSSSRKEHETKEGSQQETPVVSKIPKSGGPIHLS